MRRSLQRLLSPSLLPLLLLCSAGHAQTGAPLNAGGIRFIAQDWELVCDNTRTCRAAGYQDNSQPLPVSVLLTRRAGPRQPVVAEMQIGHYNADMTRPLPRGHFNLDMLIDGHTQGPITLNRETFIAILSDEQTTALLAALTAGAKVEWAAHKLRWRLSSKGAATALLKMDEVQGRVGTRSALVAPAKDPRQKKDASLMPLPAPDLATTRTPPTQPADARIVADASLKKQLMSVARSEECMLLEEDDTSLSVARLTDTRLLVQGLCWRGSFSNGFGMWIVNDTPPYEPQLVTSAASNFSHDGEQIHIAHPGRGLGDCASTERWVWTGAEFTLAEAAPTGMCRLIAPGGAWRMPLYVTRTR